MAERIFRGFLFLSRRIFSRIFSPDFFSSFLWEKVPRKILQENPRENPPKFIQQKSPTHFCRGAGPKNFVLSKAQHLQKKGCKLHKNRKLTMQVVVLASRKRCDLKTRKRCDSCVWHPTFFCASFFPFFAFSAPPFPRQFSSPKSSLLGPQTYSVS